MKTAESSASITLFDCLKSLSAITSNQRLIPPVNPYFRLLLPLYTDTIMSRYGEDLADPALSANNPGQEDRNAARRDRQYHSRRHDDHDRRPRVQGGLQRNDPTFSQRNDGYYTSESQCTMGFSQRPSSLRNTIFAGDDALGGPIPEFRQEGDEL